MEPECFVKGEKEGIGSTGCVVLVVLGVVLW